MYVNFQQKIQTPDWRYISVQLEGNFTLKVTDFVRGKCRSLLISQSLPVYVCTHSVSSRELYMLMGACELK